MENSDYAQFLAVLGALGRLVVLSMVLERGLAFVFEHEWFRRTLARPESDPADPSRQVWKTKLPGLRETLALGAALILCHLYKFDVLAAVFAKPADGIGMTLTGLVAAGGSAGAIALFQGFLGMSRDAREAAIAAKRTQHAATQAGAQAELEMRRTQVALAVRARAANIDDPNRPAGNA